MGAVLFGWSLPGIMSVGRVKPGCQTLDRGSGTLLVVYTVFAFVLGLAESIVDALGINMYYIEAPQVEANSQTLHILVV